MNTNDKCVICGKDTGIPHDTPIENRRRYITGSGQLCEDCYFDLYIKPDPDENENLSEKEMERLLEMSREPK